MNESSTDPLTVTEWINKHLTLGMTPHEIALLATTGMRRVAAEVGVSEKQLRLDLFGVKTEEQLEFLTNQFRE